MYLDTLVGALLRALTRVLVVCVRVCPVLAGTGRLDELRSTHPQEAADGSAPGQHRPCPLSPHISSQRSQAPATTPHPSCHPYG